MNSLGILGLLPLLLTLVLPVMVILLSIWVYQIKKNSDIQVEQNIEIIRLLEKDRVNKE